MTGTRRMLLTLITLGTFGAVAALGVFAAFSATTTNSGNLVSAGTVQISDDDGGSTALYTQSNMKPGDTAVGCIRVTYTGSLAATVHLYVSSGITGAGNFNLQIERGSGVTGAFPSCAGFTSAATIYNGDLAAFGTSWNTGVDARGSAWSQNDFVDYRFTVTQNDDTTANDHTSVVTSGTHTFTWEARNN